MINRRYFIRSCAWVHVLYPDYSRQVRCCVVPLAMAERGMAWVRHSVQGLALCLSIWLTVAVPASANGDPVPKPWPLQFHAQTYQNKTGTLSVVDLWYDFPNGRNLNLMQLQLGSKIHDVEHANGTSYYFDLEAGTCRVMKFPVGLLRPDFLSDATYVGVREIDGFKCNLWNKIDFMLYWEDVETQRPVSWFFTPTGQWFHVMTFEEGNVLEDQKWQAPSSCFEQTTSQSELIASKDDQISTGLFSKASLGAHKGLFHNAYVTL